MQNFPSREILLQISALSAICLLELNTNQLNAFSVCHALTEMQCYKTQLCSVTEAGVKSELYSNTRSTKQQRERARIVPSFGEDLF